MASHKTEEESQKEYIEVMGKPLGKIFHALWQELAWLYTKWREYEDLFGTKPSRIDLMNKAAPRFFRIVQDALWEDTILHISRLTDPPKSLNKENLSIQRLPLIVEDKELKQNLKKKIDKAKTNSKFCRDWRNRRIAHHDLKLAIEDGISPLMPASRKAINDALSSIVDVMNQVSLHYQDSNTIFDVHNRLGGGESLLYIIDDGLRLGEKRKAKIKNGNFKEDDFRSREI